MNSSFTLHTKDSSDQSDQVERRGLLMHQASSDPEGILANVMPQILPSSAPSEALTEELCLQLLGVGSSSAVSASRSC